MTHQVAFKIALTLTFILSIFSLFLISCEKAGFDGTIDPYIRDLYLYADYSNIDSVPYLKIDTVNTSKAIKWKTDFSYEAEIKEDRVNLYIRNVRFVNELGTYQVLYAEPQIYNSIKDEWRASGESQVFTPSSKSLALVLAIDLSNSTDVNAVKTYAANFIDIVLANRTNEITEIGIIGFAQGISDTFLLSTDAEAAKNFIWGLAQPNALGSYIYSSMLYGAQMLKNSNSEGKALITFTDGVTEDNSFSSPETLIDTLKKPTANGTFISSFTIGFEGQSGINEEDLRRLALNGGLYELADSYSDLEKVFNKFATTVSAVYDIIYVTNPSETLNPIDFSPDTIPLRYKIQVQLF